MFVVEPASTARFNGLIGAEAALLLLKEMKGLGTGSGATPDIFTYTTVISGVVRAEVCVVWHCHLFDYPVVLGRRPLERD